MKRFRRVTLRRAGVGAALALTACLAILLAACGKADDHSGEAPEDEIQTVTAEQDEAEAGGAVMSAKAASSGVPQNVRRGDKALILNRGGTLLPDDDPDSYMGEDKMFIDKNGQRRFEYLVGNDDMLTDIDKKAAEWSLVDGDYRKNSKGETYGSALLADYVGYLPDLQQMGEGYIRDFFKEMEALPEDECPHEFSSPLYNEEGEVIGEYVRSCGGHEDYSGMTLEEVLAAMEKEADEPSADE